MKGKHDIKGDSIPVRLKKFWVMSLCALLIINIVLIFSNGTYSSFSRSFSGELNITAGTGEDIISSFKMLTGESTLMGTSYTLSKDSPVLNPVYMEIEKADGLDYDPVVYFTVEGEAEDYVCHINPVTMDAKTKKANIKVNFDLNCYMQLVNGKTQIDGKINMRCFKGGFVNKTVEIQFSRDFLINQYCSELGISPDKKDTLPDVIALLAGIKTWSQVIVDPSGSIQMTEEQRTIVNRVAPGLIDGLSKQIADRGTTIKGLMENIDSLNKQINDMQIQLENLNATIANLNTQVSDQEIMIKALQSEIADLKNQVMEKEKQIADLQEQIQALKEARNQE